MGKAKGRQGQEHPELAPQIGERIRKIRKQEGLSLEGLALRCDMNPAYVGHIERGMRNPTLATLERICKGLGIRVEDLFKDVDAPIDVESAAIRRLSTVVNDLNPEQTRRFLHIVDEMMECRK